MLVLGEAGPEGLSLQEISRRQGEAKPAVHRALAALAVKGFVEAGPRHGHYRLGPSVNMLARRYNRIDLQLDRYRPALFDVVKKTGLSAFLMARAGVDAVCAEMLTRPPAQSLTGGAGGRVPLGIAAGSLSILATLPDPMVDYVLATNAERYASYPALRPLNAEVIRDMVRETRERGYAVSLGYYFPNEGGIGVAIPSELPGGAEMAISVSAYGEMFGDARLDAMAGVLRNCIDACSGP